MNVYDFDKTIYKNDSSKDFYLFNLKKNPFILIYGIKQLLAFIAYALHFITKTEMKTVFYIYFRSIKDMDQRVLEFWATHEHNVFEYYFLQKHPTDVVISASPEFMLKPICDKWEIQLIGSIVDKKTGVSKENCYGKEKVVRFRELYPDAHVNSFYSDSLSDSPMANIADESFLVTPTGIEAWPKG